jgi:hypothetical protein
MKRSMVSQEGLRKAEPCPKARQYAENQSNDHAVLPKIDANALKARDFGL